MSDGIIITNDALSFRIQRMISTSKREPVVVMKQQAKLLFVEVALVTPPNHDNTTGKAAERNARIKLNVDQRTIYGSPSQAYDDIKAKNAKAADLFWHHYREGNTFPAAAVVKQQLGKSFSQFDGGSLGRHFVGKRRRSKRELVFYVTNPASLDFHIQDLQTHIWWAASGWAPALRALGARLPYGVGKLPAPGKFEVEVNEQHIMIKMTNEVVYAHEMRGIQRRIDFALKKRSNTLQRSWDDWLKRLASKNGMRVKA